jgi:hypothetical protein
MHISIVKPCSFPKYYYYHKLRDYTIVAQLIVDCLKGFIDVGILSINNLKLLCKYAPYKNVEHHGLFVANNTTSQHDFPPYLMGEYNYPLITWIIGRKATYCFGTLGQHDTQTRSICWKMLLGFKKRKTSKEFLIKIGLHVSFVFGVFTIFCLLHNLL